MFGLEEQGVLPMKDDPRKDLLAEVIIQGCLGESQTPLPTLPR